MIGEDNETHPTKFTDIVPATCFADSSLRARLNAAAKCYGYGSANRSDRLRRAGDASHKRGADRRIALPVLVRRLSRGRPRRKHVRTGWANHQSPGARL